MVSLLSTLWCLLRFSLGLSSLLVLLLTLGLRCLRFRAPCAGAFFGFGFPASFAGGLAFFGCGIGAPFRTALDGADVVDAVEGSEVVDFVDGVDGIGTLTGQHASTLWSQEVWLNSIVTANRPVDLEYWKMYGTDN